MPLFLPLLLLLATPARAAENKVTLRVVSVHDGDTFTGINESNEQVKVRLDAVDAPELGQPYGQASRKALGDKIFGKVVTVTTKKHDRYGRTIGHVLIDKRAINLELLEEGGRVALQGVRPQQAAARGRAVRPCRKERLVA